MLSQTVSVRGEEEMREILEFLHQSRCAGTGRGARGTWRTHSVTFYFKQVIRAKSQQEGGDAEGSESSQVSPSVPRLKFQSFVKRKAARLLPHFPPQSAQSFTRVYTLINFSKIMYKLITSEIVGLNL